MTTSAHPADGSQPTDPDPPADGPESEPEPEPESEPDEPVLLRKEGYQPL